MSKDKTMNVRYECTIYSDLLTPNGMLAKAIPCHALMNYAITVRDLLQRQETQVKYEGELDIVHDYRSLFIGIAKQYGVEPEEMEKYWYNIDMQFTLMGITKLPNTPQIRHGKVKR